MSEDQNHVDLRRASVGQMSYCSMDNEYNNGDSSSIHSRLPPSWITLNVGGTYFVTTKGTLKKEPKSFLCRLASCQDDVDQLNELGSDRDESGAYLIDRSPVYFEYVLNYLRTNKLIYETSSQLQGILLEAEFYNIQSLISICRSRLTELGQLTNSTSKDGQITYRVLQCTELDLTTTLSSLSDGWIFEQVTSVNSNDPATGGNEFLLVLSRRSPKTTQINLDQGEKINALHGYGSPQRR